ncbi:ABC transporter substrate-binding protein [Halosolutus amylolyticus]|uniref:ABC transporter substrate-binding protein n=1 Tax=Halosolutus amylolyticus TaxID=2932267 RepID=A0ABD5PNT2_9EURY|nr:ABC transporter substrate-binding protein [Halosolutus amylolyticus]
MQGADKPTLDRRTVLKLSGAAGVTSLGAIAGCLDDPTSDEDGETDEIVITQGQFIETPDPNDHITGPYFNIFDQIYEPLFNVTPDLDIESRVVTDWEPTGDGSTELTIRDDVQFHNGEDLVASDVAFTFQRMIDDEVGPISDQAAGLGAIEGAEAIDETTVRVDYGDAAPSLAEYQFGNYGRVVKEDWVGEQETQEGAIIGDSADAFNGTGPYQVVEYEPGVEIVLEPFDDYWGDEATFNTVTFNEDTESSGRVSALQAGETDLVDNVLPDDVSTVDEADGIEIRNETSLRSIFLVMKNGVEPFDSQEFRQAMNYAVDNQGIIESILGGFGEPMTQMHSEGIFGYNPDLDPYEQDLDEAESLVEESGYAGAEITLHAPEGRYLNDASVAQTAADHIDQLENVDCEVNLRPFPEISDGASQPYDDDGIPFFLIGWGVITGDADYAIDPWINPDHPLETFRDEDAFATLEESKAESDSDAREELLQELNADLRDKAPFVFLHSQDSIYGVNQDLDWEPRRDETIYLWDME